MLLPWVLYFACYHYHYPQVDAESSKELEQWNEMLRNEAIKLCQENNFNSGFFEGNDNNGVVDAYELKVRLSEFSENPNSSFSPCVFWYDLIGQTWAHSWEDSIDIWCCKYGATIFNYSESLDWWGPCCKISVHPTTFRNYTHIVLVLQWNWTVGFSVSWHIWVQKFFSKCLLLLVWMFIPVV